MVSVHLLDVLLDKHVIKYADSKKSVAYESGRAKDAPAKAGEYDLSNCNFPLSTIRHTLATKSPRDDLMTETYSCTCNCFQRALCIISLIHTDNLDTWFVHGKISHPRHELIYPFSALVCRCSYV